MHTDRPPFKKKGKRKALKVKHKVVMSGGGMAVVPSAQLPSQKDNEGKRTKIETYVCFNRQCPYNES